MSSFLNSIPNHMPSSPPIYESSHPPHGYPHSEPPPSTHSLPPHQYAIPSRRPVAYNPSAPPSFGGYSPSFQSYSRDPNPYFATTHSPFYNPAYTTSPSLVFTSGSSPIDSHQSSDSKVPVHSGGCPRLLCFVVGVGLGALTAVAAYFCLVRGLSLADIAYTSLERFGTVTLLYTGITFSVVAVINVLYTGGKLVLSNNEPDFEYTKEDATKQIFYTIAVPIILIPCILCKGLGAVRV